MTLFGTNLLPKTVFGVMCGGEPAAPLIQYRHTLLKVFAQMTRRRFLLAGLGLPDHCLLTPFTLTDRNGFEKAGAAPPHRQRMTEQNPPASGGFCVFPP
jgi:hypothetical protein